MLLHRLSITQPHTKSKIQIISTQIQPIEHAIPYYEREIPVWIGKKLHKLHIKRRKNHDIQYFSAENAPVLPGLSPQKAHQG